MPSPHSDLARTTIAQKGQSVRLPSAAKAPGPPPGQQGAALLEPLHAFGRPLSWPWAEAPRRLARPWACQRASPPEAGTSPRGPVCCYSLRTAPREGPAPSEAQRGGEHKQRCEDLTINKLRMLSATSDRENL